MTGDVISVHTGALRTASAALAGTAQRLGHGLAGCPGVTVPEPGAAGAALAALASAVHDWLGDLGVRTAATGTAVRAAAADYDAADDRAAGRLVGRR